MSRNARYVCTDDPSSQRGIIGEGLSAPYQLYVDNGQYAVNLDTTSASPSQTFGSVNESTWQHVAITYNASSGALKGYVDGTEELDTSTSGEITTSSDDVYIGSLQGSTGFFDGRIDRPRIYNCTLSSSEVSSFTNDKCKNRQRTLECVESPDLCNTSYNANDNYHCSYGQYDDPQNTDESDPAKNGTGICCPQDQTAEWDSTFNEWRCNTTNTCGVESEPCKKAIADNKSKWLAERLNGSVDKCNSQVPNPYEEKKETTAPYGSKAYFNVPKIGVKDCLYKDRNVNIYGYFYSMEVLDFKLYCMLIGKEASLGMKVSSD